MVGAGLGDKRGDGLGTHQRRVAGEHHDGPLEAADGVAHHADGVSRAQALGLLDELDVLALEQAADLVCPVAHHDDDAVGAGVARGTDRPPDEGLVEQLVGDLGMG